ncbi:MAG: sodium pump decarboxylase subunit gamma [Desulfotalea sp.]|nr:MAG: sodium pump decarboxylase subunit gamma [Desulfotalea sp.]
MTTTELLATFADPKLIHSLGIGDKLSAGLITTVLGMGITFSALVILLFIITWMTTLLNQAPATVPEVPKEEAVTKPGINTTANDNELVAAITTALAMTLKTSTSNIVIRNINKVDSPTPNWNKAGIIEQMNSRF